MGKSKKGSKTKKGGGYLTLAIALVAVAIILPALANRSFAGDFTTTLDTIQPRALAGYTFSRGLNDPARSLSVSFPTPGLVLSWKGSRVVEAGVISIGLTASPSDLPAANPVKSSLGTWICLLEWACINGVWMIDTSAANNFGVFGGIDVGKLAPKVSELIQLGWGKTGL